MEKATIFQYICYFKNQFKIILQTVLDYLQLELLKIYSGNITDEQLSDIRLLLSNLFCRKATEAMDVVIKEKGLSEVDFIK